ncbi:putative beta-1,3-N-acetylgalactosaminyltransferase 2 [Colletotrichum truncatum]|uniref:Beta-1,3-N-acetylgalactosaminyltransferase 2 n=1 Tax=Colletotrichum truncatum TaxID=5467 RepID=A0ACC3YQD0_COLTU
MSSTAFSPVPYGIRTSLTRCVQRKFFRVLALSAVFIFCVTFYLTRETLPQHHATFEAPDTKPVVHGQIVDGLPKSSEVLEPFPYSPKEETADHVGGFEQPAPWLAAVISSAPDALRRMLIRTTWMTLYKDVPFDGRFVVSNPGKQWVHVVALENRTYGDMIVLDHIPEDDITANTIKTLEFYKWLVTVSPHKYEFVSKMDTDLWLNARGFWDRFMLPRLSMNNETGRLERSVTRTVIGELYYSPYWDLVFPHGAMYTVTWDMVELLSSLQDKFNVVTGEDMAIATLMLKGHERANFVNFKGSEKFDYSDEDARADGSAWARERTHPNSISHAIVGENPIAVHQLKDETLWLKVADCFNEDGIKVSSQTQYGSQHPMSTRWHDFWDWMGVSNRYRSRFDSIPDFLWTLDGDDWICDDIWNLGNTKTGDEGD